MTISEIYSQFLKCTEAITDTRKITPNSMFFALKGDNFNGNKFAEQALSLGAQFAVIDEEIYQLNDNYILVDDVLKTLQDLAKYHRNQLDIKIIGLTGSNGKTTTKELINVVLSQKYNTKATVGNLNNHIGVPLTLLSFTTETEIGIVEIGANHQKEIEMLCEICQPNFGYITNFGKAHLEGFGGVEGVIKGKSELYAFLRNNNQTAIVNVDDVIQVEKSVDINNISFGVNNKNVFQLIDRVEANPMVKITFDNTEVQSHLIGLYNANNLNAAIAIGKYLGVENEKIKWAIENYIPSNNRSQLIEKNGNQIILDAYNANPSSMQVALTNFFQLENKNKVAILGDMFELGNESSVEHKKLIDFTKYQPETAFYFIGKMFFEHKSNQGNWFFYENFEDFRNEISTLNFEKKFMLIKGSRGMSLERVLESL
jgi:UDP-N-acetylmuramoyl-tripeptide--D-alanyl-D-alanine ligase